MYGGDTGPYPVKGEHCLAAIFGLTGALFSLDHPLWKRLRMNVRAVAHWCPALRNCRSSAASTAYSVRLTRCTNALHRVTTIPWRESFPQEHVTSYLAQLLNQCIMIFRGEMCKPKPALLVVRNSFVLPIFWTSKLHLPITILHTFCQHRARCPAILFGVLRGRGYPYDRGDCYATIGRCL